MELRSELRIPIADPHRLAMVSDEIETIAAQIEGGEDATDAIGRFNELTGHQYDVHAFSHYWESRDLHEFALEAALPPPVRIDDVTRDELVWMVRQVLAGHHDSDYYLRLFEANVTYPRAGGLIFWPPEELKYASAEEIVDAALGYRPVAL